MKRVVYKGTVEFIAVTVKANVLLDTQPVEFSFDRSVWHTAEPVDAPGMKRSYRLLIGDAITLPRRVDTPVYVRVTDNPEKPILLAGTIFIE